MRKLLLISLIFFLCACSNEFKRKHPECSDPDPLANVDILNKNISSAKWKVLECGFDIISNTYKDLTCSSEDITECYAEIETRESPDGNFYIDGKKINTIEYPNGDYFIGHDYEKYNFGVLFDKRGNIIKEGKWNDEGYIKFKRSPTKSQEVYEEAFLKRIIVYRNKIKGFKENAR